MEALRQKNANGLNGVLFVLPQASGTVHQLIKDACSSQNIQALLFAEMCI